MQGLISDDDQQALSEDYRAQVVAADARIAELSTTSRVHAGRVESARRELLLAQIEALRNEERRGTISTSITEKALKSLVGALSQSEQSKEDLEQVSKEADPTDEHPHEIDFEELLPRTTEEVTGIELASLEEE